MDSVRDFKDMYYLVKPVSREAFDSVFEQAIVVDEDVNICYDDDMNKESELVSKLPLHWCDIHF